VQVAAGTFKAFRISVISAQPGWSGRRVFWYALEARQFVKWEGFFADRFPNWEVVALEQPMDQARITSERIVVAGKVSGGKGVARVLATLNGVEVFTQEEWQEEGRSTNNEVSLNFPISLREGKNVLLVTAADPEGYTAFRPTEVSIELPELDHGLFTYYLVQGIKGVADLNRDGIVSLQELYEYVEQQVTWKSRAVGGNQHPVMKGELEGVLPLVKVKGLP